MIDIRNFGLVGGIELQPIAGEPAKRAFDIFLDCYEQGLLIRTTGDTIALSPPLIIERDRSTRSSRCWQGPSSERLEPRQPWGKLGFNK